MSRHWPPEPRGNGRREPHPATDTIWLVGDIGATNARFGLVAPGGALLHSNTYACDDFPTIDDAIRAYLETRGDLPMPRIGALAIAAAITGDRIRMTNHPWSFSVRELRDRLGFELLVAINDFTAVALAVPLLGEPIGCRSAAARRVRIGRSRCSVPVRGWASRGWCRPGPNGWRCPARAGMRRCRRRPSARAPCST